MVDFRAAKIASATFVWTKQQVGALNRSSRVINMVLVATGHLILIWLLGTQLLSLATPNTPTHELSLNLVPLKMASHTDVTPELVSAEPVVVPAPEIQIAPQDDANAAGFAFGADQIIAPRPDPSHANDLPATAGLSTAAGQAAEVVLRILVKKDGSIGDASVAKSCGTPALDRLALDFTRAHWHYLPATIGGQAIEEWTTVLVRFR